MTDPVSKSVHDRHVILGFAGRIGSGKTEAATYLAEKHGIQYLRYSQVLGDWQQVGTDRHALREVGRTVMTDGLQRQLNVELLSRVLPNTNVVVDGLRHPIDVDSLSSAELQFRLVFLDGSESTRFARLRSRFCTYEAFSAADQDPVEAHVQELATRADYIISEEGPIELLHTEADRIYRELLLELT